MRIPLVAVTDSPSGDDLSVERTILSGMLVQKISWSDEASLIAALSDGDAILCMHAPITQGVIRSLRRCRIIVRFGAGLDNIDCMEAKAAGISVAAVKGYCTEEVANHTMALLLAWNRKICEYHEFVIEKHWNERSQTTGNWGCGPIPRLSTQTLGILGFGRIGRAVAERAQAFGMKVIVSTPHLENDRLAHTSVQRVSREALFACADYVSLHLPLTPETRHSIDAQTISSMKRGAVLINTSRGGLVEEQALMEALTNGHLGGAMLDVYESAPLPIGHPLRALKNVMLTPHVAFYSEESLLELRQKAVTAVLDRLAAS